MAKLYHMNLKTKLNIKIKKIKIKTMSKKVWVSYEYIINCSDLVEVEDDFDVDDESEYDNIELPENIIDIKINGEGWDCDFFGISQVREENE